MLHYNDLEGMPIHQKSEILFPASKGVVMISSNIYVEETLTSLDHD